ncbi:hypothetical protein OAF27_03595, partial [Verrucomicrobiales bacterium]|nr:hypothetical protein [Verrucomicrobiales bacterium]
LGLAEVRGIQGDDPRAIEKTVLGLIKAGEISLGLQVIDEVPSTDWRLDILKSALLYRDGKPAEARKLFTALSETQNEIPGITSIFDPVRLTETARNIRQWVPEDGEAFVRVYALRGLATALLGGEVRFNNWGGVIKPGASLPGAASEARDFALALQTADLQLVPGSEQVTLAKAAPFPDTPTGRRLRVEFYDTAALRSGLESGTLTAQEVIFGSFAHSNDGSGPKTALAAEAARSIEDSDPDMAVAAFTSLVYQSDTGKDEYVKKLISFLPKIDGEMRDHAVSCISYQLSYNRGSKLEPETYQEIREAFASEPIVREGKLGSWVASAFQDAWSTGDAENAAHYLTGILEHTDPIASRQQNRRQTRVDLQLPTAELIPSDQNASYVFRFLKEQSAAAIKKEDEAGEDTFVKTWIKENGGRPREGMAPETILPYVADIPNPEVRAFLYSWAGEKALADTEVERLVTASDSTVDQLIFAAGYAAQVQGDLPGCYEILLRARSSSKDRNTTARIDGFLAATGVAIKKESKDTEFDLTAARRSAVRLARSGMLQDGNGNYLRLLGIPEELRNSVLRKTKSKSKRKVTRRKSGMKFRPFATAESNARAALRKARPLLAGSWHDVDDYSQIASLATTPEIREAMLDLADPGERKNLRQVREFVGLCFAFGQNDRALPAARLLYSKSPEDPFAQGVFARVAEGEELAEL